MCNSGRWSRFMCRAWKSLTCTIVCPVPSPYSCRQSPLSDLPAVLPSAQGYPRDVGCSLLFVRPFGRLVEEIGQIGLISRPIGSLPAKGGNILLFLLSPVHLQDEILHTLLGNCRELKIHSPPFATSAKGVITVGLRRLLLTN